MNQRLDIQRVNYRREEWTKVGGWTPEQLSNAGTTLEWDVTKAVNTAGALRVCLSHVEGADGVEMAWAALLENGREISRDAHAGYAGSKPREPFYMLALPTIKPGATYEIKVKLTGSGGLDSRGNVLFQTVDSTPANRAEKHPPSAVSQKK